MGKAKYTLVDPIEGGRGVFFKDVAGLQVKYLQNFIFTHQTN